MCGSSGVLKATSIKHIFQISPLTGNTVRNILKNYDVDTEGVSELRTRDWKDYQHFK